MTWYKVSLGMGRQKEKRNTVNSLQSDQPPDPGIPVN
jgi:hypothetical protein